MSTLEKTPILTTTTELDQGVVDQRFKALTAAIKEPEIDVGRIYHPEDYLGLIAFGPELPPLLDLAVFLIEGTHSAASAIVHSSQNPIKRTLPVYRD